MRGYLRQGEAQGQGSNQQQVRLDPHDCPVCTAHWVDGLSGLQVVLGLDSEATHGVDHNLHSDRITFR